jgi:hypothetical protein
VHPDHAGVFLAGIECDGATYHGSASARDRDKVRQAVLENLGWTILRVWSTDWFKNPQSVVDRIHNALTVYLDEDRDRRQLEKDLRKAETETAPAEEPDQTTTDGFSGDTSEIAPMVVNEADPLRPSEVRFAVGIGADVGEKPVLTDIPSHQVADPERFYDASYIPVLETLITEIVDREGPLPLALLGRRVSALHGWQRTGRRISEQVARALSNVDRVFEGDTEFIWSKGGYADRLPFRSGSDRSVRDISRTEIAALFDHHARALRYSEDPVLHLARFAGIHRVSADARSYLDECIRWRETTSAESQ